MKTDDKPRAAPANCTMGAPALNPRFAFSVRSGASASRENLMLLPEKRENTLCARAMAPGWSVSTVSRAGWQVRTRTREQRKVLQSKRTLAQNGKALLFNLLQTPSCCDCTGGPESTLSTRRWYLVPSLSLAHPPNPKRGRRRPRVLVARLSLGLL